MTVLRNQQFVVGMHLDRDLRLPCIWERVPDTGDRGTDKDNYPCCELVNGEKELWEDLRGCGRGQTDERSVRLETMR